MKYIYLVLVGITLCYSTAASADCGTLPKGVECGIQVFKQRCTLCHGTLGMGEGILPMSMKSYPNTNLVSDKTKHLSRSEIRQIIAQGGVLPNISEEMPPWHDELTCLEIDSVVAFVTLFKANPNAFLPRLKAEAAKQPATLARGRLIYRSRCVLCHGAHADGKGKMAKIIKSPPPFNLTLSRLPDEYLTKIIKEGDGSVGRSPRMPPWGSDLNDGDIASLIMYLKTVRTIP